MAGRIGRVGCALSLAGVLLAPSRVLAATDGELCESTKLKAASTFAQCRGKVDSVDAKSPDAAKRQASYDKCEANLVKAYAKAENKYGTECPTVGDVTDVRDYLWHAGGPETENKIQYVPERVADLLKETPRPD